MEMETETEIIIEPHPGPQTAAFESQADLLIYGGGAGGGKTWYLVTDPLRFVDVPGFTGVIFRRTFPELTGAGGIWDEAERIYPLFDGSMRSGSEMDCRFPSGARIEFSHLIHEKTKYDHKGGQYCYIGFDQLESFSESQFFYLLSRNRSTCGVKEYVRATCNPDPGWVSDLIAWWIDQDSGHIIADRCGQLRYFARVDLGDGEELIWADTKEELLEQFPQFIADDILSVTFIEAKLSDNPSLGPAYRAKLQALPKVERERLLHRNWKTREGSLIPAEWLKTYWLDGSDIEFSFCKQLFRVPQSAFRRFATIDTAGTSKEKASVVRGDQASWSVCAVWDTLPNYVTTIDGARVVLTEMLFLRHIWRAQVNWDRLKMCAQECLQSWNVPRAYIENAHHGRPLAAELRGVNVEFVGPVLPGMGDGSEGAKLERAIASGMLSRLENGKILLPDDEPWLADYKRELLGWTGLPKEPADQIDVTSYAAYKCSQQQTTRWSGIVKAN